MPTTNIYILYTVYLYFSKTRLNDQVNQETIPLKRLQAVHKAVTPGLASHWPLTECVDRLPVSSRPLGLSRLCLCPWSDSR